MRGYISSAEIRQSAGGYLLLSSFHPHILRRQGNGENGAQPPIQYGYTRGRFYNEQCGFRKLRSDVDQITKITITISDGFQGAKPQHDLVALLNFSKALDRV